MDGYLFGMAEAEQINLKTNIKMPESSFLLLSDTNHRSSNRPLLHLRELLLLLFVTVSALQVSAQSGTYRLLSPDHQLAILITTGEEVRWSVMNNSTQILLPSKIAMELGNGDVLGRYAVVRKSSKINIDRNFATPFYKKSSVKDQYSELTLNFAGNYSLVFRAYNDGVA